MSHGCDVITLLNKKFKHLYIIHFIPVYYKNITSIGQEMRGLYTKITWHIFS